MEKLNRQEQKARTRQGLVNKATELFARQGIASTSTAQVARSLRVSHGALFVHFPTREELLLAVVDQFGARLGKELGRRIESHLTLEEMLEVHLSVLADFEDFYARLIAESESLPPEVRSQVYAMNASLSYRFHGAAEARMKKGELKKLDQVSFFRTWMALLHYHLLNRDLFSDELPILKHKGGEILRLFLTLIQ
jgi:AcrR family transcriptional regulator